MLVGSLSLVVTATTPIPPLCGHARGRDGAHVSDDHPQRRQIVFVPIPFADAILSPRASHRPSLGVI